MKNHSFSESILRFLNGKGFYIALVFCLAALGGSGWYLWQEFHTAQQLASQVS
jgi:predicted negative regulator of RcsB-dependent stress response